MHDREAAAATLWQLKGSACASRSTTSAPATRRWPTCAASRSTCSRSPASSSTASAATRTTTSITRAIVELAGTLGLLTVAEGIETHAAVGDLRAALGCDLGQGYLFSRPVEADAASALLTGDGMARRRAADRRRPEAGSQQELAPRAELDQAAGTSPAASISSRLLAAPRGPARRPRPPGARGTPPSPAAPTPPPRWGPAPGDPLNRPR